MKKLAFGLPILKCLLEEGENTMKMLEEKGKEEENVCSKRTFIGTYYYSHKIAFTSGNIIVFQVASLHAIISWMCAAGGCRV